MKILDNCLLLFTIKYFRIQTNLYVLYCDLKVDDQNENKHCNILGSNTKFDIYQE